MHELQDDSETLYTIFCADQTANNCQIDGDLPFTFAEGPKTLHFSGADPGTMYARSFHVHESIHAGTNSPIQNGSVRLPAAGHNRRCMQGIFLLWRGLLRRHRRDRDGMDKDHVRR